MQRPNIGNLLQGLRRSLEAQVLPTLSDDYARRQLKAGLHLIARLERCWDLPAAHLAADNDDIERTLEALLAEGALEQRIATMPPEPQPDGYNDPALRTAAQRNLVLHRILLDMPDCDAIRGLHGRMVRRDLLLVGDVDTDRAP